MTFTSRGCIRRCPFCLVPEREGLLHELTPIPEGYIIQDNQFLACSKEHRQKVYAMLARQRRYAVFAGGLDCRLLTDEIADELRQVRISSVFLAADTEASIRPLREACRRLAWLGRRKLRCYALLGYDGETLPEARERLEAIWEAGALPFAQLFRPADGEIDWPPEWRALAKAWSRPAATYSMHEEVHRAGD